MKKSGRELYELIKFKKDKEKAARKDAQIGMFPEIDDVLKGTLGFSVCAKRCGLSKAFHKRENAGKRSSLGIHYDGHPFVKDATLDPEKLL